MDDKLALKKDINFYSNSVADPYGKVFEYDGKILRAIWDKRIAEVYVELLGSEIISDLFNIGLIATTVNTNINIEGAFLILEHEKVSFHTVPGELTDKQFYDSCKVILDVFVMLNKYGYYLKDAHPWNVLFHKGIPKFIDFTSIDKGQPNLEEWYKEFYRYCRVPIYLAAKPKLKKFSKEYRKESIHGFGLKLMETNYVKQLFHLFNKKPDFKNTTIFLAKLIEWFDSHRSLSFKQQWSDYIQADNENDVANPQTIKDIFVLDILKKVKPKKVLDAAANRGYFSEMAHSVGAAVIAFDYEEACVDACNEKSKRKGLDITSVLMDFRLPSPASDIGLSIPNSLERFNCDITIALGLVHHLCLTQNFPVELFCRLCMNYSSTGVIMEYIFPEDKHVAQWNISIPNDYSLDGFTGYFAKKFKNNLKSEILTDGGIKRIFIYFYND